VRYERERPGELLHVDTKKLGRFWEIGKRIRKDGVNRSRRAGWQYLHVAIDDHSRLAYCEILRSERKEECVDQPTTTARLARSQATDQPRLTRLWSVHLAFSPGRVLASSV
jgi:hypothetical protein